MQYSDIVTILAAITAFAVWLYLRTDKKIAVAEQQPQEPLPIVHPYLPEDMLKRRAIIIAKKIAKMQGEDDLYDKLPLIKDYEQEFTSEEGIKEAAALKKLWNARAKEIFEQEVFLA